MNPRDLLAFAPGVFSLATSERCKLERISFRLAEDIGAVDRESAPHWATMPKWSANVSVKCRRRYRDHPSVGRSASPKSRTAQIRQRAF
jgi:hypothetical protein